MDHLTIPSIVSEYDLSTEQGRSQAIGAVIPHIAAQDSADRDRYLRELADAVGRRQIELATTIGSAVAVAKSLTLYHPLVWHDTYSCIGLHGWGEW